MVVQTSCIVLLGCIIIDQNPLDLQKEFAQKEKEILIKLQDEKTWMEPKNKDSLLSYLEMAKTIRSKAFVPILIPRLAYSPYSEENGKLVSNEVRYPVMNTLKEIGLPAVSALLEVAKNTDPDDGTPRGVFKDHDRKVDGKGYVRHWLAVYCLVQIYNQGGFGQDLAKQRIELELKRLPENQHGFLRQALESSPIRLRSKLPHNE